MASVSIGSQKWDTSTQTYSIELNFYWDSSEGGDSVPYNIYYYHGKMLALAGFTNTYDFNGSYQYILVFYNLKPYLKFTLTFLGREYIIAVNGHPNESAVNYYPSYYPTMQRQWYQYDFNTFSTRGETGCCVANTLASCREKIEHDIRPTSQTKYSVSWTYGGVNQSNDDDGGLMYEDALTFAKTIGIPNAKKIRMMDVYGYPDIYRKHDTSITFNGVTNVTKGSVERYNEISPSKYSAYGKISDYKYFNWYDCYDVMQYVDSSRSGNRNAVFITLEITQEFDDANDNKNVSAKGVCPRLTQTSKNRGGHSMIVLGWKKINDEYYWICQNSWGYKHMPIGGGGSWWDESTWIETGDNGLIYIPFSWTPRKTNNTWSGGVYGFYAVIGGNYNTDAFAWDTPKVKGKPFNVTASEWTRLQKYINECLGYVNKNPYNFKEVKQGDKFTIKQYSDIRTAINNSFYLDSSISLPYQSVGDQIKADEHLNKIVESLNSIT